jgi:ribosomal 30S subunit maturation factor RimM
VTPPAAAVDRDSRGGPILGRLGRTYQLEGALHCRVEGAEEAAALRRAERLVVDGHGTLGVRFVRAHGNGLVVAFQGFRSPERAQALVNATVRLDPSDGAAAALLATARPALVGLPVSLDGAPFGHVDAVLEGAQTLLRVRSGGALHLVPAAAPYVSVLADEVALRDPPPGLLDDPDGA